MKSIDLKVHSQTIDNKVMSVCFIDKSSLALQNSEIARKIRNTNPALFEKINEKTKLINATIERQETLREFIRYSSLMVRADNEHEYYGRNILNFSFKNSSAVDSHRFQLASGQMVDVESSSLENFNSSGSLDLNNITADDLNSAKEICKISRLELFDDIGVESFLLVDNLKENFSIKKLKYKIVLNYEEYFTSHVDFILREVLDKIKILRSYFQGSRSHINYDPDLKTFKERYSKRIFDKLGFDFSTASRINLSDPSILESDLGRVAVVYYNAQNLLDSNVDKNLYNEVMKKLLPTKLSSPATIESVIRDLSNMHDLIEKKYKQKNKVTSSNVTSSGSKIIENRTSESTSEIFELNREKIGYRIFQKTDDIVKLTKAQYISRCESEKQRYFPQLTTADAGYMYPSEVSDFLDTSNYVSFLTPLELVMEGMDMVTDRGLEGLDVQDVKAFRIVKSARFMQRNSGFGRLRSSIASSVSSDFNLQIESLRKSIKETKNNEEVDPLINSKFYIGDDSYFQDFQPERIIKSLTKRNRKNIGKNIDVISGIIPRRFLRPKNSITSIKQIQIGRKNSPIKKLITERKLSFRSIPPQIKFMMTTTYQPAPNIDPLKNHESREIIEETQKNIFLMEAHVGFDTNEFGLVDLNKPLYREVDQTILSDDKNYLIRALDYEIPDIGIVKDKMLATIYNNLYIISKE